MTLSSVVSQRVVRPVVIGWLDFASDPAYGWSGNGMLALNGTGDPDLDGQTYSPIGGAVEISDSVDSLSSGGPVSVSFSAPDNDAEVIRQIVRDRRAWQLRKAKIIIGFYVDDWSGLEPNVFENYVSGVMVQATTGRSHDNASQIIIEIDTDLRRAFNAPSRVQDHARHNAGDLFSTYLSKLATGPIAGGSAPPVINGGSGPRSIPFAERRLLNIR